MVKANGWNAEKLASIDLSPFDTRLLPLHAPSGGASLGLFEALAIAAKKLFLLILVGPFLALRAALGRRTAAADVVREGASTRTVPTRTPAVGARIGGLRCR